MNNVLKVDLPASFEAIKIPAIIIGYIIPFILLCVAIKFFLDKMNLFRSLSVQWILAITIALSSVYFLASYGSVIITLSIFAICAFKISGIKGIFIGLVAAFIYWVFIMPWVLTFIS